MGSFDGAEVCELVGLFILDQCKQHFPLLDLGLYRDDALGAHDNMPGPKLEQMKKQLIQIFKKNQLKITIETNLNQVDFLDVTMRLCDGIYWPFQKPNNSPLYIHAQSNHPLNIKKTLPTMVSKRISDISSSKIEFNKTQNDYDKALKASGFQSGISYIEPTTNQNKKKSRQRKIIWFNPPYSENVETNIGRLFLNLIKKHFPVGNRLSKIFNKNTLKLSYSCMPNMRSIISRHNKALLKPQQLQAINHDCNCRNRDKCPLSGKCLEQAIIYKAIVNSNNEKKQYIGLTENTFKIRYGNHKSSLTHPAKKNATKLSQYFWELKEHGRSPTMDDISWSILQKSRPYVCGSRKCDLCLSEKLHIILNRSNDLLNKRTEIANKCRHNSKFKLCQLT